MNKYIIAFGLFSYWFTSAAAYAQSVCPPDQELHFGVCMQVIGDSADSLEGITTDDIPVLDGVNENMVYVNNTELVEDTASTTPITTRTTASSTSMQRSVMPSFRGTIRPDYARPVEEQIAVNHSTDDELINLKQSDMLNYRLALREQYRNTSDSNTNIDSLKADYNPSDEVIIDVRIEQTNDTKAQEKAYIQHLSYNKLVETGASYPLFIALMILTMSGYNLYLRTRKTL